MAFDGHRWWVDEGRGSRQTSRFDKGEAGSFGAGIADIRVSMTDMVWVSEGGHVSLLREGDYPPLRGSFAQTGENGLLYTRGSVPYHGTYPGAQSVAATAPRGQRNAAGPDRGRDPRTDEDELELDPI